MKKMLILGGFPQMIDIVMTAREMGIYTIVADNNPASAAKRFADKALDMSTDDTEALLAFCKSEGVDGVFTGFEDFNIHIAQRITEALGLPFYATKEQLSIVTDKKKFKEKCLKHGVPAVQQYSYDAALLKEKYPYIVKPTDSYGSRGITVAKNREELERGVIAAKKASKTASYVIERFIDSDHGTELFYTAVNGQLILTATADRYTVRNGETTVPLPVAEVFPSRHRDEMVEKLDSKIRAMLSDIGIKNGLVLIQALYQDGEFFVYEMAYRLTGEQHYRLVERQQGISLSKMMIALALGERTEEYNTHLLEDTHFIKPSINLALILNPGKIAKISGLSDVYKIDEVISYNLTHKESDEICASGDYSHMLIRINMVAESYGALCRAVDDVNSFVTVLSDDGEDMLTARFKLPQGE